MDALTSDVIYQVLSNDVTQTELRKLGNAPDDEKMKLVIRQAIRMGRLTTRAANEALEKIDQADGIGELDIDMPDLLSFFG